MLVTNSLCFWFSENALIFLWLLKDYFTTYIILGLNASLSTSNIWLHPSHLCGFWKQIVFNNFLRLWFIPVWIWYSQVQISFYVCCTWCSVNLLGLWFGFWNGKFATIITSNSYSAPLSHSSSHISIICMLYFLKLSQTSWILF